MIRDIQAWVCDGCNTVQAFIPTIDNETPECLRCEKPMQKVAFFRPGPTGETKHLVVSSGYGYASRKPFVTIESADIDKPIQMSPAEARAFAMNLLEAADGAESDGFIVEFFGKEMEQSDKHVAALLYSFRKWRNEHRETPTPNTPAEDL